MSYSFKISLISLKSKVIITPYSKKYATFLLYTGLNFLGGLCNSEPDGKGIATLSIVSSKEPPLPLELYSMIPYTVHLQHIKDDYKLSYLVSSLRIYSKAKQLTIRTVPKNQR